MQFLEKPALVAGFFCLLAGICNDDHHGRMTSDHALFPSLLGESTWQHLPAAVQRMHGAAAHVIARGEADVTGATHLVARLLRRVLGLPMPGPAQQLDFSIERHGTREVWTRRFASRQMRTTLDRRADSPLLYERLGPTTLGFELSRDGNTIDWQLRSVHLLGLPLPRAWFGQVLSRSSVCHGRYTFTIDTRLPLLGRLVSYHGWLEPLADDR